MNYSKKDATMTKGFAAICMVSLHLFCRLGNDILGSPLIWFNETIPFVYWIGFFSEICVPLYSICVGYALEISMENGNYSFSEKKHRIFKLLLNYWIVLCLFSIIGLLYDPNGSIPGNMVDFIKSIVLLHSYNGAWWYLNAYIIIMLIPTRILFCPIRQIKLLSGSILCLGFQVFWYFCGRFNLINIGALSYPWNFGVQQIENIIGILPYIWMGGLLCKYKVVGRVYDRLFKFNNSIAKRKVVVLWGFITVFVTMNILHKAALLGIYSVLVFLLFNVWEKTKWIEKIWMFFGKHSTNIWLTHMFFYLYIFKGLVVKAQYPLLILASMLILCIATSYIIKFVEYKILWFTERFLE